MTYPTRKAPEEDLVVVNFRTKNFSPELTQWGSENPIAIAESCARQVWYGMTDTFVNFPVENKVGVHLLRGKEAYVFLIKLVTGMDSTRKGESDIKGQFYGQWPVFKELNPDIARDLDPILQHLKSDSRSIQSQILVGHKRHEHSRAAVELSGRKKGANILIIGDLNDSENLSNFTDRMARTVNDRRYRAGKILITHPDAKIAAKVCQKLQQLENDQGKKIIACPVEVMNFVDLPKGFEQCDYSYIDLSMGKNLEADEFIVSSWQSRARTDNKLIHMRGNPSKRGQSDPLWIEASLDNYISSEDIRQEMKTRGRRNQELRETAEQAFHFCAKLRLEGKSPSDRKVRDFARNCCEGEAVLEVAKIPMASSAVPVGATPQPH